MCGISGIVSQTLSKEEIGSRLTAMGDLQRHRGPDDQKQIVFPIKNGSLGFGFVRLSILDLETGMQPIQYPEDQTAIICNGQIYNYIELRQEIADTRLLTQGDIEIALHLYRAKGFEFLHLLNGMYAGAIFDPNNHRLLLFRDRFGIKPLYYTDLNENFTFSSEIKPLLMGSGIPRQLNNKHLATYFTYRYVPGEETMFYGVKRLPPGSFLEYNLKTRQYRVERYWEYQPERINNNLSIEEAAEGFQELLSDAIRIRLRSDVEVGGLLSSGIDSSAVVSIAAKWKPSLRLFTIAFDEDKYNELPQVQRFLKANISNLSAVCHHTRLCGKESLLQLPGIVRSLEEPLCLGAVIPTDQVCRLAGEQVKVVVTGEGADEIFAGYRKSLVEMAACMYTSLSASQQKEMENQYPELSSYLAIREQNPYKRYIQSELLFTSGTLEQLLGQKPSDYILPEDALPTLNGSEHPLNAMIALESRFRLPDYVILRLDKLSMRHSLETRTPFLDFRLAEFAATLPVNFKVNLERGLEKYICRYAYEKYNIFDNETVYHRKQPFTIPLADWLSDPSSLPDFIQDILLGDVISKQGILNSEILKDLMDKIAADTTNPWTLVSDADRVFAILMFTLWYNEFFC